MSKIIGITLEEFHILMDYAQKHHAYQNEPIPEVHESQYGKIRSCLETPFQTFDKQLLYKGFYQKAAILFYVVCKNHALINGNKRMACLLLGYFCSINNYKLALRWENFYNVAKAVTNSAPDDKDIILAALVHTLKKFTHK